MAAKLKLRPVTRDDDDRVWTGVVLLNTPLRAARGLTSKALREVFGRQRHYDGPNQIHYNPPGVAADAFYDLTATQAQVSALGRAVQRLSRAAGWTYADGSVWSPIDPYLESDTTELSSDADLASMGLYRRSATAAQRRRYSAADLRSLDLR
tara:strand:- start:2808 stop:3263 length:456 start_codon:yes stop_codon:yes gene_type:complete